MSAAEARGQDSPLFPALDWAAMWDDTPEAEPWIVRPIVSHNRVVSIYSVGGAGKSLFMLELAAAMATGRPVHGQPIDKPVRVLYIDHENLPHSDVIPRLKRMGYTRHDLPLLQENLRYLSFPDMFALNTIAGASQLLAAVDEHGASHVVLDTVSRVVEGDENSNDTWLNLYNYALRPLKGMGIGSTRLDHSGKDEDRGARGGSAKNGDVDLEYSLKFDRSTSTVSVQCTKSRIPEVQKGSTFCYFRRDSPTRHEAVDAAAVKAGARELEIEQKLMQTIADNPGMARGALEKVIHGDNNLIRDALDGLAERGAVRVVTNGRARLHYPNK